jgi:hypothetical protein
VAITPTVPVTPPSMPVAAAEAEAALSHISTTLTCRVIENLRGSSDRRICIHVEQDVVDELDPFSRLAMTYDKCSYVDDPIFDRNVRTDDTSSMATTAYEIAPSGVCDVGKSLTAGCYKCSSRTESRRI